MKTLLLIFVLCFAVYSSDTIKEHKPPNWKTITAVAIAGVGTGYILRDVICESFIVNDCCWMHAIEGLIGGVIGNKLKINKWITLSTVTTIGVLWEIYEWSSKDMVAGYQACHERDAGRQFAGKRAAWLDTGGDITAAAFCTILVCF